MVAQHPLRERFRSQLMLALYRSGQADALRVYREGRETLVEQLGLEPRSLCSAWNTRSSCTTRRSKHRRAASLGPECRPRPTEQPYPQTASASTTRPCRGGRARPGRARCHRHGPSFDPRNRLRGSSKPNSVGFIDADSGRVTRSFPVGRLPVALAVARDSVWVANQEDKTVSRLDRRTGKAVATIPVGAHPTGITVHEDRVWVWTVEGMLVPIDPRFNVAREAVACLRRVSTQFPRRRPIGTREGSGENHRCRRVSLAHGSGDDHHPRAACDP